MFRILEDAKRSAALTVATATLAVFVVGAAAAGARDPSFTRGAPLPGTILFQTRSTLAVAAFAPSRMVSGQPDALFSTRRPVGLLAADGNRVASGSCDRIVVWEAPGQKSMSLETPQGICDSARGGLNKLALGDGQVAEIVSAGGNVQEQALFVGNLSVGRLKYADGDSWNLLGAGKVLAYQRPGVYPLVEVVRIVAGRRVVVMQADGRRGHGFYSLAAVGGGRMAVVSDGAVTVHAADGSRVAEVAALERDTTRAIALTSTRLAVERTMTLDLYNAATGKETSSLRLGSAAALELAGLNEKLALLKGSHHLVLLRLGDDKLISLPLRGVVDAKLTEAGLFYAYNTPKSTMKGHIVFEPTAKLLARF